MQPKVGEIWQDKRVKTQAQPESTAPVCDACGPEGCRCEEDRR